MKYGKIYRGLVVMLALALIVGNALSNEVQAIFAGTVCGLAFSIPVAVGLVIASRA